jgi:hypothetical protein
MLVAGCEWDNTDDEDTNSSLDGGGLGLGSPGGSGTPNTSGPTVSGTAATTEPLADAQVCIDENTNGRCDDGEPSTVTDSQGRWTIEIPERLTEDTQIAVQGTRDTTLADSGDAVDAGFALVGIAKPNFTDEVEGVFVSPLSTLVENEVNRLPSGNRDEAVRNIAGKLGTDVDILENYLDPPADATPTEDAEYNRLGRIVSVVNELATEIDSSITDQDRENLSDSEVDQRIFSQIADGLEQITEDVNRSTVEQPSSNDFDSRTLVQSPEYEDLTNPLDLSESTPTLTELESRIAGATASAPFFERRGFETFPVQGARLIDLHLFKNPLTGTVNARISELNQVRTELANRRKRAPDLLELRDDGGVYYEARQRIIVNTEADAGIADIQIGVPRFNVDDINNSTFQVVSEALCDNGDFACDELTTTVRQIRALSWSGFSLQTKTIQTGHAGTQRYLPLLSTGEIIASSESTGFASRMDFGEFDLEGLSAVEAIDELVGGESIPELGSFTFAPDSKAYTFSESLVTTAILSTWPSGGTGNLCPSPGLPDASVTASCNLVYGNIGQSTGLPAETFSQALYPVSQQNQPYTSLLENGEPVDAIGLTGPTDDLYVARLFGSSNNDEGIIRIYRQLENDSFETLSLTGQWEREASPFDRIDVNLPSGFYYTDARIGFELGNAFLFERQGFLRSGWAIPSTVNVDSLFGRKQVKYAFNQTAFDQIIADLDGIGALTEHPFYTRQLIEDLEEAIADTEQEIRDDNSVGDGGQTGG